VNSDPRTEPFVRHHRRYEDWFERHRAAYLSELLAVRALLPWQGRGLEIGVPLPEIREIEPVRAGTGRGAFLVVRARRR
jgi:hypothetical protein